LPPTLLKHFYSGLEFSHLYFQNRFGRNGANFEGGIGVGTNKALTRASSYAGSGFFESVYGLSICPNATWNSVYGRVNFCTGLAIPDIVGHEYTHAVAHFSIRDAAGQFRGLDNFGEPGALSEGFADVFGEAIERHALGSNDWNLGTAGGVSANASKRNLANAESAGLPSTTRSGNFACSSEDSRGIHINCTVLGHAAYRLAMEGTLSGCQNQAIGQDKQEAIFYRALTTYLAPSANFQISYIALILSCRDLFGIDSFECRETAKALNAGMLIQNSRCSDPTTGPVDCDECPLNLDKAAPGRCGCATVDTDDDNDGTPNCIDGCSNDSSKQAPGTCGCGVADSDNDGDSTLDCQDACPSDASKLVPGICGCGVQDIDANGNGTLDCIDVALTTIRPNAPVVRAGKKSLSFSVSPRAGVTYIVKIVVRTKLANGKNRSATKVFKGSTPLGRISNLPSGAKITFSYFYVIEGTPLTVSLESGAKTITVK
jgi:hypothetical protein